jgi:hypothetical protein
VNFQFQEAAPPRAVVDLFRFPDDERLSDLGYEAEKRAMARRLKRRDELVNLTISLDNTGVLFDFNYHHEVEGNTPIADVVPGYLNGRLADCLASARQITATYDLVPEELRANA